uniref:tRNA (adenine(58)-N(1))-methyltransferase non-catalytic subunit TRM6 n=1 Tax=Phallusia mammillata TaxID=59560 RepID=A0A6F9DUZ7_9ASCI|nr:tRNA (adenine(58)-N(1))-methyltransferase non-catalytic subunit TRM6-like [Phallusia mammillata]
MNDYITLGESVILKKGDVLKAVKLLPKKLIVFERMRFVPDNAEGALFGSTFKIDRGGLVLVNQEEVNQEKNAVTQSGQDNRGIVDTHGDSQTLKRECILQMKEEGQSGEQIIGNLVNNSSTFTGKTKFSQTKYVKKKQKKYSSYIQIHKPTARLICKLYINREPAKILNMNLDSISQIVTATNIRQGSKVVVLETCSGMLLALIMERLGLEGCVVNLHVGETPSNLFALSHLNLSEDKWKLINSFPLSQLGPLIAGHPLPSDPLLNAEVEVKDPEMIYSLTHEQDVVVVEEKANLMSQDGNDEPDKDTTSFVNGKRKRHYLTDSEKLAVKIERRKKRHEQKEFAYNCLQKGQMDAIIMACRFHPTPIFMSLMGSLAPSKPFAIYHEYQEPLMELFVQLSVSNSAINLQLCETFMRNYQVLSERTHPHVMMSTGRGYLLTGTKVNKELPSTNKSD